MRQIRWYYPESLEQVPELLGLEGVVPHGGGTGILLGGLNQIKGLIDLGRLELKSFHRGGGEIVLGAALSYTEAAEALAAEGPPHILSRSLSSAATQPLRNRITLGGSIALFPYWSDLMGPLLALDAELTLVGKNGGARRVGEYVKNRELRQGTLIASVSLEDISWQGVYYRHTRTLADRPAFGITALGRGTSRRLEEARIVVVGCSGRYRRLTSIEEHLQGLDFPDEPAAAAAEALSGFELEFPARMGFSAEYLQAAARVELERALAVLLRRPS